MRRVFVVGHGLTSAAEDVGKICFQLRLPAWIRQLRAMRAEARHLGTAGEETAIHHRGTGRLQPGKRGSALARSDALMFMARKMPDST